MKITCIDKELKTILSSGFYKIPRFQRPYLWEKDQVEEFWNDAIANEDPDYFIGSMVVFLASPDTFGVVDGQQRLTTITMILCALRDCFATEKQDSLAQGIQNLVEKPDINNLPRYVLQTETSYPYLQEHIQKFGKADADDITPGEEEERLQRAFDLIASYVNEAIKSIKDDPSMPAKNKPGEVLKKLKDIRDRLLRLKLIFVELDDEDDAYLIFETLNTRGKDLTVSDLVKNHVTRLIKPTNAKVDRARDRWDKIVEILEGSEEDLRFNSFLHHLWLSEHEYTTEKKLFKAVRTVVKKQDADAFLKTLLSEATTYREIQETSYRKWKKSELDIKGSLDAMSVFRVKQQLPMIMAAMRSFKTKGIRLANTQDILRAIENFHFIFTAVTSQRSSGGISMMYASHARQLLAAKDSATKQKGLGDLKKKLHDRKPSFQEFEEDFMKISYSNNFTKQKRLVQYILARIDSHNAGGLPIDYERMTIEHLASQNPSSKGGAPISKVGLLGNLILVDNSLNQKLANKDFSQKLKILKQSRVWVDPTLAKASNWGDAEIEARGKQLADLAYNKIWKL
jgi:Protein of unknown function DUF262/Protein of unknown function (DUF1524)